MLEVLLTGGMDLYNAVRMMVPPAWQNVETMDGDLRAFYEYNSMHMEPWDGPAGLVMTDVRHAVCMLDHCAKLDIYSAPSALRRSSIICTIVASIIS